MYYFIYYTGHRAQVLSSIGLSIVPTYKTGLAHVKRNVMSRQRKKGRARRHS